MRSGGSAGRAPRSSRVVPSHQLRSRAPKPRKAAPAPPPERRRQTVLTARAAVLAVALASVALAVALPFKIWLGQRGQIASLATQTHTAQQQVARLKAANQRWQDPAYVEKQAQQRLHFVLPGTSSHVLLGKAQPSGGAPSASSTDPTSTGTWYGQLWSSVEGAGADGSGR